MNLLKSTKALLLVIILILVIIPFTWFSPGEMDLGGDSGRLYFYDPQTLLKSISLYSINPEGTGNVESNIFNLPFLVFASVIKFILPSPYLVISFFNIIKLTVGFLAVYAIIRELLKAKERNQEVLRELSAIIGGLFYIFSPMFIGNFDRALANHNQVFLNPLMFYFILRFFLTKNTLYIWGLLLISFIFSENFSWVSAPPLFAFYPLAILFLMFYTIFIQRKKIPWKEIVVGIILFLSLHSFHLIPNVATLFEQGSSLNKVFSSVDSAGLLDYFYGVLSIARVSTNILSYSELKQFGFLSIIIPFIVIFGLLLNIKKQKTILLTSIFFLITFFFVTGNITHVGVKFYSKLFYIPGFVMFRNFIGQWQFVFYFFYALLFGQSLFLVLSKFSKKIALVFSFLIGILLTISAWPFIDGSLVNKIHFQSAGVKYAIVMDPRYEEALSYIKALPDDGKILTLPFTDCCYQVIHGINKGAYIGLSTISFLGGKKDYSGYSKTAPFSEVFLELVKEKDYASIKRMLGLLNIRYIFYNSDPQIYDTTFPSYPYGYVRKYFPDNQKEYGEFVSNLTDEKIFERGPYGLYTVDKTVYLPHFYIPTEIILYENTVNDWYGKTESFFVNENDKEVRSMYVESDLCNTILSEKACDWKVTYNTNRIPKIAFSKINPTKYKIRVFDAKEGYMLVFSEAFHGNWKVFLTNNQPQESGAMQTYFDGAVREGSHKNIFLDSNTFETLRLRNVAGNRHVLVNGYANGWYITPEDTGGRKDYEFIVEMTEQRRIYIGLTISLIACMVWIAWGIILFRRSKN